MCVQHNMYSRKSRWGRCRAAEELWCRRERQSRCFRIARQSGNPGGFAAGGRAQIEWFRTGRSILRHKDKERREKDKAEVKVKAKAKTKTKARDKEKRRIRPSPRKG